jgi:nucleotide-binding universal stress UspA family protein
MKKILVILNGGNTHNTISFACYMAGFTQARLSAIFPHAIPYGKEPALKQVYGSAYVESIVESDLSVNESYVKEVQKQEQLFSEICEKRGIPYHLFRENEETAEELIEESRLADMIILDTAADVRHHQKEERDKLTRSLLANAECPVIVAPAVYEPVDEIILCYDGSASAVFAMKQLTYLLPGLENTKITALQVSEDNDWKKTENKKLREWLADNYRYVDVETIKGTAEKELFNILIKKNNALVVMGAYGRGTVSRFFHQSMAEQFLDLSPLPVFITHY